MRMSEQPVFRAAIRSKHLTNKTLRRYRYANLLGVVQWSEFLEQGPLSLVRPIELLE
jgi:hypothetical protein